MIHYYSKVIIQFNEIFFSRSNIWKHFRFGSIVPKTQRLSTTFEMFSFATSNVDRWYIFKWQYLFNENNEIILWWSLHIVHLLFIIHFDVYFRYQIGFFSFHYFFLSAFTSWIVIMWLNIKQHYKFREITSNWEISNWYFQWRETHALISFIYIGWFHRKIRQNRVLTLQFYKIGSFSVFIHGFLY